MNRPLIALAASLSLMVLAGAHPVQAGQCETACDKSFQTCNGSNPDTSVCLPKWGQCKRSCTAPAVAPAKAVTTTTTAKVTKVAQTTTKTTSKVKPKQ